MQAGWNGSSLGLLGARARAGHIHYSVAIPKKDSQGKIERDEYNKIVTTRKDLQFLPRWVKDKSMKHRRRFVMRPDGDFDEDQCYNLWKGYRCNSRILG